MNITKLLALTATCALSATGMADAFPEITPSQFPDADSVIVDECERVRYHPDGTYDETEEAWTKILTEKGRREASVLTLDYSQRYGSAEVVYVGAISTNGEERVIDVSATTRESTDNSSMGSNIYDPLDRKITVSIPGLQVGETLHVKTRETAKKPRCEGQWADFSVMEWTRPIVKSTYAVIAPRELPLKKIDVRHPLGNLIQSRRQLKDGATEYLFTVTNSAQVFPEPNMPALHTCVQNVLISTAANWSEISRWYWQLSAPHLAKTNAAMVAKVAELIAPATDRETRLKAIFRFVSQEIRYLGLTMEDTSPGYAPHDVDISFDNRYGVCRDKAALLVAMLRLAGFEAYPVLIQVGAKLDPEVPQPFFNHAIVAVATPGGYTLMDPTNENTRELLPGYLANRSYLVCRPQGEELKTTPVVSPDANELKVSAKGHLDKSGCLYLEYAIAMNGINDTAYRGVLAEATPADQVKLFERLVRGNMPGAELVKCVITPKDVRDTEQPLAIELGVKVPERVLRGKSQEELSVPFLSESLGVANVLLDGKTSLAVRKYPLQISTTARVKEELQLELGEELGAAQALPKRWLMGTNGLNFVRAMTLTNGVLTGTRELAVGAVEFSPAAYRELREELKEVEAATREQPIFGKNRLADAEVHFLDEREEVTVFSDREWVKTNTFVCQALNYAGKQRLAELRFAFHPAWKRVEILEAVVSNANGQVVRASEREKNIMDADWVSAAPRYPASKQLVLNLPSVEVGSVITLKYVVTVTYAPKPFYETYTFDSLSPVEHKYVRVNDWSREAHALVRLPDEPRQASASLWRDQVIVSSNRFEKLDLHVGTLTPPAEAGTSILSLRNWMAKYVKISGPSFYEMPLELQLTDPAIVLRERYGTRLDYLRTLAAMLRGAGFPAEVVLVSNLGDRPEEIRRCDMFEHPNLASFAEALVRVRDERGQTLFLGTENEYTPLGTTAYDGDDYFDPVTGQFGVVKAAAEKYRNKLEIESDYEVLADGTVEYQRRTASFGSGVGGFRKRYAEILPELRSRRYQEILGAVSQAASATSELKTDVDSYPATLEFSCHIPDFATVAGESLTFEIPWQTHTLPNFIGEARLTPFEVAEDSDSVETIKVRFPEGYTVVEHLPDDYGFSDPLDPQAHWLENTVKCEVEAGVLTVTVCRQINRRRQHWFKADYYELIKDWSRRECSPHNCKIVVRRSKSRTQLPSL